MTKPPHTSIEDMPLSGLLHAVGARQPAPGGGAVAAVSGALAAALGHMVAAYSAGKKDLAPHHDAINDLLARLDRSRRLLLELADADAAAYAHLASLERLPENDPARAGLAAAAQAAAAAPRLVVAACAGLVRTAEELAPISNHWLHSDLAITAILADAAARSAGWMVEVNLGPLTRYAGPSAAAAARAERDAELAGLHTRLERTLAHCRVSLTR